MNLAHNLVLPATVLARLHGWSWVILMTIQAHAELQSGNLKPTSSKGQMCLTSKVVVLSLSLFRLWKCQEQSETAPGFSQTGDKEASRTFSTLSSKETPCKNGRADLRAPPQALQACRSGCLHTALLKVSILGGPISKLRPALKHIHTSGQYGPPIWGRRAIQLRAKLRQSKHQPRLEAKESFQ